MVRKEIKNIEVKKLKMAKKVLAVLEVMGIKEDDLDKVLLIPEILNRLKDLEEFKETQLRIQAKEASGQKVGSVQEKIKDGYLKHVEEFYPNGRK